jgi:hypothetical protein
MLTTFTFGFTPTDDKCRAFIEKVKIVGDIDSWFFLHWWVWTFLEKVENSD